MYPPFSSIKSGQINFQIVFEKINISDIVDISSMPLPSLNPLPFLNLTMIMLFHVYILLLLHVYSHKQYIIFSSFIWMVYCTCFVTFSLCSTSYFWDLTLFIHVTWVIHFNSKIIFSFMNTRVHFFIQLLMGS